MKQQKHWLLQTMNPTANQQGFEKP